MWKWPSRRSVPVLGAAIAAAMVLMPGASSGVSLDHLECYRLHDLGSNTRIDYTLNLDPADAAFGLSAGCRVRSNSREICVAVDKTNVTPGPFAAPAGSTLGSLLCYRMRCPKGAKLTVDGTDQLGGTRTVAVARDSTS